MYDSYFPAQIVLLILHAQVTKKQQTGTNTNRHNTDTSSLLYDRVIIVFNTYQLHLEGSNENNSDTSKQTSKGYKLHLTYTN